MTTFKINLTHLTPPLQVNPDCDPMDHLEGQSSDEELEGCKDNLDEVKVIETEKDIEASSSKHGVEDAAMDQKVFWIWKLKYLAFVFSKQFVDLGGNLKASGFRFWSTNG